MSDQKGRKEKQRENKESVIMRICKPDDELIADKDTYH